MKDIMKSEMPAVHLKHLGALQVSAGSGRGPGRAARGGAATRATRTQLFALAGLRSRR